MSYSHKAILVAMSVLSMAGAVHAQMASNTPSAAQPSRGIWELRQLFQYSSFRESPDLTIRDTEQAAAITELMYGVTKDITFGLRVPTYFRSEEMAPSGVRNEEAGVGDIHIMAQKRIWQEDTAALDTRRLAVMLGLDIPTYDLPFGSDGFDPMIGLIYTSIQGRHGLNAGARYMFTTGSNPQPLDPGETTADLVRYDLAYLYRVMPTEFTETSTAAAYLVMEMNGLYETNGDQEIFLAPGFLWEAKSWALEASIQLPAFQELEHRPETRYILTLGFRLLF